MNDDDVITLELTKVEAEKLVKALESQNEELIKKIKTEIEADELLNDTEILNEEEKK